MSGGARRPRLSDRTLADLPSSVQRPAYDRDAVRTGIVHLGIGAFHRAHQAVYTDDVLAAGDLGWGIAAASLRSPDTRDALAPQDGLYTLAVRDRDREDLRVVGAVRSVLVAPEDPDSLLAALADPGVRVVTLTVTEKGYCHRPATGELDEDHPDIRHDLASPDRPRSAPGFVLAALARRRANGIPPFTVLSCDNLPTNGRTTRRVLTRFAELRDPELGRFIAGELACPSCMVDRIVPATTAEDRAAIAARLGLEDAWPVLAEPFTQWVVEDAFPTGRPDWPGATFTRDVEPYELMKLRLLNGAHSTLAYLGCLSGRETVADAMASEGIAALVATLMEREVAPTLPRLPGIDLSAYRADLLARFRNPALRHRTAQVATDGSQKLPQRLLGTIRDRLAAGAPFGRLALGVGAWMRFVAGTDDRGRPLALSDPLAAELRARAASAGGNPARLAEGLLGVPSVFGTDLATHPGFREAVTAALARLAAAGAERAAAEAAVA